MELTNAFSVSVPVDTAWAVLTDLERVAPCMPGARLEDVEGEVYRGAVKVKVGPVTTEYRGAVRFLERDESAHRAVLRAEGRETRGQGNASATVTATLVGESGTTAVEVVTDLTVTGRVAQFGRGVLGDVSAKLLGQFVERLEASLAAGDEAAGPADGSPAAERDARPTAIRTPAGDGGPAGGGAPGSPPDDDALDAGALLGSVLRRRLPVLAGVALALLAALALARRVRRRGCRG